MVARPEQAAGGLEYVELVCGLGTLSLLDGDVVSDADSLRPVDGHRPVPRVIPPLRAAP